MNRSRVVGFALLVALAAFPCRASTLSFSVLPASGSIAGPPGSLIGWGYMLSNNDPAEWLVTTSLNSDAFLYGTSTLLFDFPVLSPNSTVIVPFDAQLPAGLFQLQWDANAPIGAVNTGNFTLSAEWWTDDPAMGGSFDTVAIDQVRSYSAAVGSPEPSTGLLLLLGLLPVMVRLLLNARRRSVGRG